VGTVTADATRLQQLFENLFRNSVEHGSTNDRRAERAGDTAEHGSHAADTLTVSLGRLDDDEGFYLADDGPGIDPERRDRIFELGHTDADGGSGLGLAIVREITDAHGWTVTVTASDSGGARFDIRTNADVTPESPVPQ
jgi:signal transduction histidine kinase